MKFSSAATGAGFEILNLLSRLSGVPVVAHNRAADILMECERRSLES